MIIAVGSMLAAQIVDRIFKAALLITPAVIVLMANMPVAHRIDLRSRKQHRQIGCEPFESHRLQIGAGPANWVFSAKKISQQKGGRPAKNAPAI